MLVLTLYASVRFAPYRRDGQVCVGQVGAFQVRVGLKVWPAVGVSITRSGHDRINDSPILPFIARPFDNGTSQQGRQNKH